MKNWIKFVEIPSADFRPSKDGVLGHFAMFSDSEGNTLGLYAGE